jgi:hypothetical protein
MQLIIFILASYGLTLVVCYGKIFDRIRPSYKFFHCPMCMGFWCGLVVYILGRWSELLNFDWSVSTALLLGWLSSGTSYALAMLVGDEGLRICKGTEDD